MNIIPFFSYVLYYYKLIQSNSNKKIFLCAEYLSYVKFKKNLIKDIHINICYLLITKLKKILFTDFIIK